MYNLTGTQSGLSHGLPLCSKAVWPAIVSSSNSQYSSLPLCWAQCVCLSLLSWPLWMSSCQCACPTSLSRVTRLYPPPVSGILSFLFSSWGEPLLLPLLKLPGSTLLDVSALFFLLLLLKIAALHLVAATSLTTIMMIIMIISAGESGVADSNYMMQSMLILILRVSKMFKITGHNIYFWLVTLVFLAHAHCQHDVKLSGWCKTNNKTNNFCAYFADFPEEGRCCLSLETSVASRHTKWILYQVTAVPFTFSVILKTLSRSTVQQGWH